MEKSLLNLTAWILFLGGRFGFAVSLMFFFSGKTPAEYGVLGITSFTFVNYSSIPAYSCIKSGAGRSVLNISLLFPSVKPYLLRQAKQFL